MDLFAPCDFTNIQDYPHDFPLEVSKAINEVPLFQGNKAISTEAHVQNVNLCISKCRPYTDYEDVKMQLFVLTLDEDPMDWFLEFLDNTFESLQSIIDAFENKYGDKERVKAKAEVKKIKEAENDIIELTQMVKNMQINQAQLIKNMELNQTKLIADHAKEMETMEIDHSNQMTTIQKHLITMKANHDKEISAMQARLVQMERSQAQNFQPRNNRNNNTWQKKGPSNEQRSPNPLESTNLVDEAPPYCRACDALHC